MNAQVIWDNEKYSIVLRSKVMLPFKLGAVNIGVRVRKNAI